MEHVLVTGGSSGIGREIVLMSLGLAKSVAVVGRGVPDDLMTHARKNHQLIPIVADFADPIRAADAVIRQLSRTGAWPDIIVSAAVQYGRSRHGLGEDDDEEWLRLMNVNALAPALLLKRLLPTLLRGARGLVVHLTSDVAFTGGAGRIAYAASKSAAQGLMRGLAEEVAGSGISVVSVLPERQVATPGLRRRRPPGFDFSGYQSAESVAKGVVSLFADYGLERNGAVLIATISGTLARMQPEPPPFDASAVRAYDVRGRVPAEWNANGAISFGKAIGTIARSRCGRINKAPRVIVGRDARMSSTGIEAGLIQGLLSTGVDVHRVGLVPTPLVYYGHAMLRADAAITVTASHNPKDYNGLKIVDPEGPVFDDKLARVAALASAGPFAAGNGNVTEEGIIHRYTDDLLSAFPDLPKVNAVWDAGSGAAGAVLDALLPRIPGHHVVVSGTPDGEFPHRSPDPSNDQQLGPAATLVREGGFACGFAFDGDADRLRAIDNLGRVVAPDCFGAFLAESVVAKHPDLPIIIDVRMGRGPREHLRRLGADLLVSRVGHSFIKSLMNVAGASLAIESSGHLYFGRGWFGIDDPFFAALACLNRLGPGKLLSDALGEIPTYFRGHERRVPIDGGQREAVMDRLLKTSDPGGVCLVDGIRVDTPDGWWLVRPSNSEPVLSISWEAYDSTSLTKIEKELVTRLADLGIDVAHGRH
jgi:phosphomannomutase